ncbi:MAG: PaaI family thioesterase [Clostridiales bacterium]|nr:PaaI family thioesterase [Clostridiales bacterium]
MSTFSTFEEAREFFRKDLFATTNGMELTELTETESAATLTVTENHQNAMGGVMGGVIFTLCDLAFAALVNNLHKPTVALDSDIKFLSTPKGKQLTARAKLIKNGRTTIIVSVLVTDESGKEIAIFSGTGYKL